MSKPIPMLKNPQKDEPKTTYLDFLDEGQITDWLADNGKKILYGLASLIALLIIIYAISSGQHSKAEQDYLQAANDYASFSKSYNINNPAPSADSLNHLNSLMAKYPELHAAYDAGLAQTLLNRSQVEEAQPYALASLKRVKTNHLTYYNEYAENTLLISQQHLKEALEKTLALQQKMQNDLELNESARSFGDELFAFNLLRIAMLQQELGNNVAERQAWQEWKNYAGLNGNAQMHGNVNPLAFRTIIQGLTIGSISLADYISYRERLLKN